MQPASKNAKEARRTARRQTVGPGLTRTSACMCSRSFGPTITREIVNDLDLAPERARLRVHHLGSASDNTGPLQKIDCRVTSMLAEVSHFRRFIFPVLWQAFCRASAWLHYRARGPAPGVLLQGMTAIIGLLQTSSGKAQIRLHKDLKPFKQLRME